MLMMITVDLPEKEPAATDHWDHEERHEPGLESRLSTFYTVRLSTNEIPQAKPAKGVISRRDSDGQQGV